MIEYELTKALEEKVAQAQSDEDVLQIFADAGMQVTLEQLKAEVPDGELNEDALDNVSGGSIVYILRKIYNKYFSSGGNGGGGGGGHRF